LGAHLGFFDVMVAPLLVVLLFSSVLSYLGVHVIRRQVIFVDLALGQVAALGASVGFLFGIDPTSPGAYIFSLCFALVAAAIFAVTRPRGGPIPHEAVIGLVFAAASAATYLVVDRSPHGAEHVQDVLTGTVLWTTWSDLRWVALVVVAAGLLLLPVHSRLRILSSEEGGEHGTEVRAAGWDFFFYAIFGLVISVTVRTIGVLPTFGMLVAPAILGCLIASRFRTQFAIAVGASAAASVAALLVAWHLDLPGGPPLVLGQGLVLLGGALVLYLIRAEARGQALTRLVVGGVVVALLVLVIVLGGRKLAHMRWSNPDLAQDTSSEAPL